MATIFNLTFAARDPLRLAQFWATALGYEITQSEANHVRLRAREPGANLLFLKVDGVVASSAIHLDLAAFDPFQESIRLIEFGATAVDVTSDGLPKQRRANGLSWFVLADPEGNEFCVGGEP